MPALVRQGRPVPLHPPAASTLPAANARGQPLGSAALLLAAELNSLTMTQTDHYQIGGTSRGTGSVSRGTGDGRQGTGGASRGTDSASNGTRSLSRETGGASRRAGSVAHATRSDARRVRGRGLGLRGASVVRSHRIAPIASGIPTKTSACERRSEEGARSARYTATSVSACSKSSDPIAKNGEG
jgi:hypothetical protein